MRKLLAVLSVVAIILVSLTGCFGSQSASPTVQNKKPWSNSNGYEKVTYKLEKSRVTYEGDSYSLGEKEATGSVTYELFEITTSIKKSDIYARLTEYSYFNSALTGDGVLVTTPGAYSVLFMDFSLTYVSGEYSGKTDVMKSVVLFKNASLSPVYSEKEVSNASNGISYKAVADYNAGKNFYFGADGTVETGIKGSFDNELIPYVIRGRSALTTGISDSFAVNNAVYSGVYNTDAARNMVVTAPSTYYVSGLDADKTGFVKDYFDESGIDYYAEETRDDTLGYVFEKGYSLKAFGVALKLNETNSGPSTMLYYSQQNFSWLGQYTSSVLLMFTSYEYDVSSGKISYALNYKIDGYKTSRLL